jgi:uncharacterized protein YjbJ (UPF0337 family)
LERVKKPQKTANLHDIQRDLRHSPGCVPSNGTHLALHAFINHQAHNDGPDTTEPVDIATIHEGETSMNWDTVKGNWKQVKGKVQQQWGKLTKDDVDVIEGKREELSGKLQERYGYAKDKAEKEIDAFCKKC